MRSPAPRSAPVANLTPSVRGEFGPVCLSLAELAHNWRTDVCDATWQPDAPRDSLRTAWRSEVAVVPRQRFGDHDGSGNFMSSVRDDVPFAVWCGAKQVEPGASRLDQYADVEASLREPTGHHPPARCRRRSLVKMSPEIQTRQPRHPGHGGHPRHVSEPAHGVGGSRSGCNPLPQRTPSAQGTSTRNRQTRQARTLYGTARRGAGREMRRKQPKLPSPHESSAVLPTYCLLGVRSSHGDVTVRERISARAAAWDGGAGERLWRVMVAG